MSDPTGRRALTDDVVRKDLKATYKAIDQIVASIAVVSQHWSTYVPRIDAQRRAKAIADITADEDLCVIHQKAGIYESKGTHRGVCDWCGSFRVKHDTDPAPELLRARDRGERVTTALMSRQMPALKVSA